MGDKIMTRIRLPVLWSLLLSAFCIVGTALGQTANPVYPSAPQADMAAVAADNNTFATDLYAHLAAGSQNLLFSPYSISSALAMTYAGARGQTAAQMAHTLHFSLPDDRLHAAFGALS